MGLIVGGNKVLERTLLSNTMKNDAFSVSEDGFHSSPNIFVSNL